MLKPALFFPESQKLRDKWWHRLATVIFWLCSALAAWTILFSLFIAPATDRTFPFSVGLIIAGGAVVFSFIPGIIYRAILFIAMGESWKDASDVA